MIKKPLIIIVGPTAVGKTSTSINLAKALDTEIISADSMQIYKYMNIGSAKPSLEEREGIAHYLMDEIDPGENFSVSDFQKKCSEYIDLILNKNKIPIIVGGTGLYINSIIYKLDFTSTASNWELRKKLEQEASKFGNEYVHNKLKNISTDLAKRIHPNNLKKVIRAIEVFNENGEIIKSFEDSLVENPEYDYILIGLNRNRTELYDRINRRVDILIENGLVDEVNSLLNKGLTEKDISMKGIGYKEIIEYINGKCSLDETIQIIKRNTRRYAKRQITWFKRYEKIKWLNFDDYEYPYNLEKDLQKYIRGYFKFI